MCDDLIIINLKQKKIYLITSIQRIKMEQTLLKVWQF